LPNENISFGVFLGLFSCLKSALLCANAALYKPFLPSEFRFNSWHITDDEIFAHGQKSHQAMPFLNSKLLHLLIESKKTKSCKSTLLFFGVSLIFQ
jgi:hypothetical protein